MAACLAAFLMFVTVFGSMLAADDSSVDVADGVAAYEAGDYPKAYELLKPAADAGNFQARYLLAQLLSGDLPDRTDFDAALSYLDGQVRCQHSAALSLFGFLYQSVHPTEEGLLRATLIYKEAARAGNRVALANLGGVVGKDLDRPLTGAAYLFEAAQLDDPEGLRFMSVVRSSSNADATIAAIQALIEEKPFEERWPLLDPSEANCPDLVSVWQSPRKRAATSR